MFSMDLADDARMFPLEPRHAEEFFAHLERGRDFIGQYVAFPDRCPDPESARTFLATYALKAAEDGARFFGIRLDGTLVGGVLFPVFDAQAGNCEIGCWLEPATAGRGLVTKACRVLIDYAFGERGMRRVEWRAASRNEKSLAVAERLGMTREGVLRQNRLHRGVLLDIEIWSILAPEWSASRA
ncbi:GNAT family N-acetyltransferase [Streptomyces xanthophaeus]|uniref:GNAT family N-acetyltransferase n=1 Tax=Streptomyces xanthophaeus TaxID=67385 RepID=UPI00365A2CE8